MSALERVLERLEARDCRPRGSAEKGWDARCPVTDAHAQGDRNPSFHLGVGDDGRALVTCHRGCSTEEIVTSLDLTVGDLFADGGSRNGSEPLNVYVYVNEAGEPLFEVGRFPGKKFLQRRPGGSDWRGGIQGVRRVLYHLPQVIDAIKAGKRIHIVEGEKDVHAIEALGEVATTNPGGAGKWRPEFTKALSGADVVVVADRDEPGRKHAEAVAAALNGVARSVRVVEPVEGKDASDHLAAGHTLDAFKLVEPGVDPESGRRVGVDVSSGLRVTSADLSRARPPRWAWENRIVLGSLNLLLGNEGSGKGTLSAWLIARLTRGDLPGDLRHEPAAVGVLGDEDDFDSWWTPKLHAAGADLDLVKQIDRPDGGFVNIREDREKLALACTSNALRVLFFDQLLDNLGVGTDDWRQKAVRDALQPLRSLARELEVAALGCLHPNKRGASFRELVAGAPAFNAASRSSLLLAEHPDDPDTRVLVRGKGNLSAAPHPIEFRIVEHRFEANGHTFKVPLATEFTADGSLGIDDLLGDDSKREARTNVGEACEIIEALLPRDGEWHPARTLIDACEKNSIDERTAQRAAEKLRLDKGRTKTFPACAVWRWPSSRDTDTSRENGVASVASVGTANARNPLWSSRDDTHDTPDSENKRHVRVVAEESAPEDRSAVVSVERFVECSNPDGHRAEHHRTHPSGEGVVCWLCHPPARATA